MKRHRSIPIFAVTATEGLRDIRPPVALPFPYTLVALIGGVIILITAIAVWLFLRRRAPAPATALPTETPYESACRKLDELRRANLIATGRIKDYYTALADIVRHYLEDACTIKAPDMTTPEFLEYSKHVPQLRAGHRELLAVFLDRCDMVKFAKYGPSATESDASFDAAKKFIEEMHAADRARMSEAQSI